MIYPDKFPENQKFDNSREKEFYIRFRRELPKDWDMFYSFKFFNPGVPIREIDYIVVSPYGVFLIELKNAKFKFMDGKWYIYDSREKDWKIHKKNHYSGPIEQIDSGVESFIRFLEINHYDKLPINRNSIQGTLFLNKNEYPQIHKEIKGFTQIVFHKELEKKRLDFILEGLSERFHLIPLDDEDRMAIRNLILLNGNYVPSYKSRRDEQLKKILALTSEQMQAMEKLKVYPRILISGVPGSGKTLLAVRGLEIASERKWNTVFICPTNAMAAQFSDYFEDNDYVTVHTFESIRELKSENDKFDFAVIEEAQNLSPEIRMLAEDLLVGGWRGGRWAIFMDQGQGTEKIYWQLWNDLQPEWEKLTVNIRNPREIFETACILGKKLSFSSAIPDALNVKFLSYKDLDELQKKLYEVVDYAIDQLELLPEQIVILSHYSKEEIGLDEKLLSEKVKSAYFNIEKVEDGVIKEGKVGYSRIKEFVGLETSFVILIGVDDLISDSRLHENYLALTRSNYAAAVLYDLKVKSELDDMFSQ